MLKTGSKHILLAAIFLTSLLGLSVSVGTSSQTRSILSQGTVSYEDNNIRWGVCVHDLGWEDYGGFLSEYHVDMLKDAGANAIRLVLNKWPWDRNDTSNTLGVIYKDYAKQVADWFREREIYVLADLHRNLDYGTWGSSDKIEMMKTPSLRQAWIDWGSEVIVHCNPDAILVLDEPCGHDYVGSGLGQITEDEYRDFVSECIQTWQSVKSEIPVFLYAVPYHNLGMFHYDPLPYENIVYVVNSPYYSERALEWAGWREAYWNGRLEEGKSELYRDLDRKIGPLKETHQICIHVGTEYDWLPNWEAVMVDGYDYCKANNIYLFQWKFGTGGWGMLTDDRTQFNEIGQLWVSNTQ